MHCQKKLRSEDEFGCYSEAACSEQIFLSLAHRFAFESTFVKLMFDTRVAARLCVHVGGLRWLAVAVKANLIRERICAQAVASVFFSNRREKKRLYGDYMGRISSMWGTIWGTHVHVKMMRVHFVGIAKSVCWAIFFQDF